MSKTVTYAEFDLISVKAGKGLTAKFYDRQNPNKEVTVNSNDTPHPDLVEAFESLKENFAESLGLLSGWDFARENNRKNEEALIKAKHGYNDEVDRVSVSGIVFTGGEDNEGVKITGSLQCEFGVVGLAGPSIIFDQCETELSKKCESLCDGVKKEVWSYLFKNKKAQAALDLDSDDEEGSKSKGGLNVA